MPRGRLPGPLSRRLLGAALLLALAGVPGPLLGAADAGPPRKPPPPPPPGLAWEGDMAAAQARAQREGRPILVCVNALENERANNLLAGELYPSEAWGRAARGFVCVVANPGEHASAAPGAAGRLCGRYGHVPCAAHQDVLRWVLRTFAPGGDLISPQHLILEPDGGVAYRKEYFTGEEGPFLFGVYLSRLAPARAQRQAASDREADLAALAAAPLAKVGELARAWLARADDGLAAAGVLTALDDAREPQRRAALLEALAQAPPAQVPVLVPAAEAATAAPDESPAEALGWVRALLAADRPTGAWAAARALVRARGAPLRADVLRAWVGGPDAAAGAALAPAERARLEEALRLAGAPVPRGLPVPDDEGAEALPALRRARARARAATGAAPLPADLASLAPGAQRRALLGAAPEEVARRAAEVEALLAQAPYARVRVAAALALLGARRGPAAAVARAVLDAVFDPLEGPEARAEAVRRLPEDPGEDPEAWSAALAAVYGGGR